MGGGHFIKQEKTKEEKILAEFRKLKRFSSKFDKDKKNIAEKLCKKAAFMDVTLDEMQETITTEGSVIEAVNGNGFTVKMDHPALKGYNAMIKNYTAVIKQLVDLMPQGAEEADELLAFVKRRKS